MKAPAPKSASKGKALAVRHLARETTDSETEARVGSAASAASTASDDSSGSETEDERPRRAAKTRAVQDLTKNSE